ncbi:MAG TPA: hypothetical protein PLF01_06545 [Alphaproteobacteria bacterium]|nr:hypothetical protein [Alphaproteobacteria bacterium]
MSLKLSDLSVLAYANNFTLWHYKTDDASVATSNYFDNAADMMNVNDLIIANIDTDGTPATQFYIVTGISGGAVTIAAYA